MTASVLAPRSAAPAGAPAEAADTAAVNKWDRVAAIVALLAGIITSVMFVTLYPDSYQQDGGTHYLFARWAWVHQRLLFDVWGRPLFTVLYSVPALIGGYPLAKLLTVGIAAATAWQTWRLAVDHGLQRPALGIALLWLQPSFLLVSSETMTEPLFALLLVLALRAYHADKRLLAAFLISATTLTRPEGFFVAAFWGGWMLFERRESWVGLRRRLAPIAALATFPFVWWLTSTIQMQDRLYILHNWPSNWSPTVATYGKGLFWDYFYRRREVLGPLLEFPFAVGALAAVVQRALLMELANVAVFFLVHSTLRLTGTFGSAGYPRYFVCVAPAIALIMLLGWDTIAAGVVRIGRQFARPIILAVTGVVLVLSYVSAICYVDDQPWSRDARLAIRAVAWLNAHPQRVTGFAYSQAYLCILLDCDPDRRLFWPGPRDVTMSKLRSAPPGTLILWDDDTGPAFYGGVTADSVVATGFVSLHVEADSLKGQILPLLGGGRFVPRLSPYRWNDPRFQRIWVLYKPQPT